MLTQHMALSAKNRFTSAIPLRKWKDTAIAAADALLSLTKTGQIAIYWLAASLIARLMGQYDAHQGPTGPRWAPCWPHGPCYLVSLDIKPFSSLKYRVPSLKWLCLCHHCAHRCTIIYLNQGIDRCSGDYKVTQDLSNVHQIINA